MITDSAKPWISVAYGIFAREGPGGLRIEYIARCLGKNKSSFYHHFADLDLFTNLLLEHHVERSLAIASRMAGCTTLDPDLLELLVEVKEDILFQRQLRIHRDVPAFQECIERTHRPIMTAMLGTWTQALELQAHPALAQAMLALVVDNFYLRTTPATLDANWLRNYLTEILQLVAGLPGRSH